ncbi:MAG: TerB family tellurite resistance protein [Alphaproteobacteria bacterium]|nr:TerB family tellurite resistance protein [Alphaproteobacteria bacterium]
MLNKFFQSFNKPEKNENISFNDDLYMLIYEIIIADHEISSEEIDLSSELLDFYFQIPKEKNEIEFKKLVENQHFNTDLSQNAMRLKTSLSYEQRMDVILICWQVLMVDKNEDQLETSTVRTISTLLGLEDKDFILIRNRVKDSL